MRVLVVVFSMAVAVVCLCPDAAGSVRLFVAGDSRGSSSGVNTAILTEIAEEIISQQVDAVLFPGDLVYGSPVPSVLTAELTEWRGIMQAVYDSGIVVLPCRGNHDAASKASWDAVFSGPYALPANGPAGEENVTFSWQRDNVLVIGLDQYATFRRVNQTWLEAQFSGDPSPHVFVFGHEPAFKVQHSDCLDDYPADRDVFWQSMEQRGVRAYFCGHDHFYDHADIDDGNADDGDDIHQFVVGTAGAPLRDDGSYDGNNGSWTPTRAYHRSEYGYLLVDIEQDSVTMQWFERNPSGDYAAGADYWAYSVAVEPCCQGRRGDVDLTGTFPAEVDSGDLAALVDFLFSIPGAVVLPCEAEADINASDDPYPVDSSDLGALVNFVFSPPGSVVLPDCP